MKVAENGRAKLGEHFLTIGSSNSRGADGGNEDWEWTDSSIDMIFFKEFKNVRILNRSDLPLCMHLHTGKEFLNLLKGEI